VVVDDGSTDATAAIARRAGALVVSRRPGGDKGMAMATAFDATVGDVVVFLDADVENASGEYVPRLVGPLLCDEAVLVKGFYERPLHGQPVGGGRVTELLARPLIELLFPEISDVRQPLAGETAAHRWVFEKVGFATGYGVEIGLLIDVARDFGVDSIAQVDLGVRVHRNRPLADLRPQADDVLRTALGRAASPGLG
jgi:glucosyl-3-phosphoglycerate synthase